MEMLDQVTEAYREVQLAAADQASALAQAECQGIHDRINPEFTEAWASRGQLQMMMNPFGMGLVSLRRQTGFLWLTKLVQETEAVLHHYLEKRTTDVWLLQTRREMACRLLRRPVLSNLELSLERSVQNRLAAAVAIWARPGSTMLPGADGKREVAVSEELVTDIHVVLELLELCETLHLARRRFLLGGILTIGAGPTPVVWLPRHVEGRLKLFTDSGVRGTGPFARLGSHVPPLDFGDQPPPEDIRFRYFLAAARVQADPPAPVEHASSVRPFTLVPYDAVVIARALAPFDRALRSRWGLGSAELVAAIVATGALFRGAIRSPEEPPVARYMAETRAIFTVEEEYLLQHLSEQLPSFAAALGKALSPAEAESVAATFLATCASSPDGSAPLPAPDGTRPRVPQFVPLLFRAGDKLLLDMYQVLLGLSSLLHEVDLTAADLAGKGSWFEDEVRLALASAGCGLEPVPSMEQEFRDEQRVVGEADVVVRLHDTAFLVECKSRRLRGIESCASYSHAMKRTRRFGEWARQVRRTAEFVSRHPRGPKYEVPAEVRWIVPVVCTASPEAVWQDDPALFLKREEIPIVMSPGNLVAFIASRAWTDRTAVHQYSVGGEAPVSLPPGLKHEAAEYYQAALAAARDERLVEAVALFEQAVSIRPSFAEAWANLGAVLARTGHTDRAMAACLRALELDAQDHLALRTLAALYVGEGWLERARVLYGQAVDVLTRALGAEHDAVLETRRLLLELKDITDEDTEDDA